MFLPALGSSRAISTSFSLGLSIVPKKTSTFSSCSSGPRKEINLASPSAVQEQLGNGCGELKLILGHDRAYFDALPGVLLDKARDVAGVSSKITILLDELVGPLPS